MPGIASIIKNINQRNAIRVFNKNINEWNKRLSRLYGVSVARASKPDEPFVINSTADSERLVWSEVEINNKEVPLIAIMKETKANSATTGAFSAVATFVFSYE